MLNRNRKVQGFCALRSVQARATESNDDCKLQKGDRWLLSNYLSLLQLCQTNETAGEWPKRRARLLHAVSNQHLLEESVCLAWAHGYIRKVPHRRRQEVIAVPWQNLPTIRSFVLLQPLSGDSAEPGHTNALGLRAYSRRKERRPCWLVGYNGQIEGGIQHRKG